VDVTRVYPKTQLAALVTSDGPVSVERVLTFADGSFGATGNAGTEFAATTWLFAEGSGAGKRQTFLTVLNPGSKRARVTAVFSDPKGKVLGSKTILVDGLHRGTIRVNDTTHAGAVAITLTGDRPIVVERPYYLGNPNKGRTAGTLVLGRNGTGTRWVFPSGETTHGGKVTLLVLNPTSHLLKLQATYFRSNAGPLTAQYSVVPGARLTIDTGRVSGLAGRTFGVQLAATNGVGFVAEESVYNSDGTTVFGAAGQAL
jgi:hypothetical protein